MRQSRICGRCDGVGPEVFRFLESRASGPTLRFGAGLERERTFAAVDVAHVGYAVSYAEIHQAVIVWRIVVFADARHVLETCLAQRSAGGSVIGKICLAGYDNPIFARLPAGQFEFWVVRELAIHVFVARGGKPELALLGCGEAERPHARLRGIALVDRGEEPRGDARQKLTISSSAS